jgi:hypothetical protein
MLGVEAPDGQVAKTQEYLNIPSFRNAAGSETYQCPLMKPQMALSYF